MRISSRMSHPRGRVWRAHVASLVRHPVAISDWRSVPTELRSSSLGTEHDNHVMAPGVAPVSYM